MRRGEGAEVVNYGKAAADDTTLVGMKMREWNETEEGAGIYGLQPGPEGRVGRQHSILGENWPLVTDEWSGGEVWEILTG